MSLNQERYEILTSSFRSAHKWCKSPVTFSKNIWNLFIFYLGLPQIFPFAGEGLVSDKFEQNNQIFATEHDFTPKNLKKLDKFNNENYPNDTNDLEISEMGKVSNQCTCPDRSYANCHRTSRCVRCGQGFCTYGDRHTADDIIEPHNRHILPKKFGVCCSIWSEPLHPIQKTPSLLMIR